MAMAGTIHTIAAGTALIYQLIIFILYNQIMRTQPKNY